jgi:hypothetical protein
MKPMIFGPGSMEFADRQQIEYERMQKFIKENMVTESERQATVCRIRKNLKVAEAWAKGEEVQHRYTASKDGPWFPCSEPKFTPDCEYRIKPKAPREWWINRYPNSESYMYSSKEAADGAATTARTECVHVREFLEETK